MSDDEPDTDDDTAGVPDSDPDHIDPGAFMADLFEDATFELDDDQDADELREFIEDAESGEHVSLSLLKRRPGRRDNADRGSS